MNRTPTRSRLLASDLRCAVSHSRWSTATRALPLWLTPFSTSARKHAEQGGTDASRSLLDTLRGTGPERKTVAPSTNAMDELANASSKLVLGTMAKARNAEASSEESLAQQIGLEEESKEPYHFHIFSHKHNTHITVTKPNRDAIISLSCGNLGFKKSQRKHYDSAYQLGAYVIDRLHQQGWHKKIKSLEVVLRGFGPGREAVTKVLLGNEGRMLRSAIVQVADSTRLKFGGTRSPKPRRLG